MKNKVTLAISTFVLCSSVSTVHAAKHSSLSHHSKHATVHKTSHYPSSSHHSHHAHHSHHTLAHRSHDNFIASSDSHLGRATLYSKRLHGRRTASGEPYDMYAMTAAHRSLPLASYVEVTNLKNNRTVVVRINDRGPFHTSNILDLSTAAAEELGIEGGSSEVKITPLAMNTASNDELE
jgi:rare lipoprotein A